MELVEEWPTVLRRAITIRLAAALTFLIGAFGQAYLAVFAFLAFMPYPIQVGVGGLMVFIVVGCPIILARLVQQPKMQAKVEKKIEEKADAIA